ncbi:sulfate adenylyltransferase subunit CysN [Blastochloris viridis]|uniref:Multifunctional fusion protein n=1 Tax=Blastochloris viridis TaxID=1079 RepID=A0A0H5BFU3_BLAVI|nr:sulfate adenylyltransferase subunit CysN [Blastochloris viridis]ALK10795.1 Bifunctional enzyme CysN/CysC [Blastochloris viridis]BAR99236.1 sulfate adenylyltransferase subunit 1 [Blastochloris viridis]CUU43457.1 Bifunctional enzyme CysN/CysC [Blastochloris viridis]
MTAPPAAPADDRPPLRVITCGSVDDGKSTLIGRLLYDCRLILDDQLAAVARDSRRHGTVGDDLDLALLVDGLAAEREQGITIDVAYRFFRTGRRAFILADTPGHEQFTRNMATAASTAEAAVVLVDARKGVLAQTRRHSFICALLGIGTAILAVNKIDLVDASEDTFSRIAADYRKVAAQLGLRTVVAIPVSARWGDNVAIRSARTPWYGGPTVVEALESIDVAGHAPERPFRFPVQWVNRPGADFRGYAGTVASGAVAVGDAVVVAGSGQQSTVARIVTFDGDRAVACAGDAVTLVLADAIDLARGDLLAPPQHRPVVADQFSAQLVWMSEQPMLPGRSYLMRIGTAMLPVRVTTLKHRIDIGDFGTVPARTLALNDIGVVNVATARPVAFDAYADNRRTGAFILIDRDTNATAGAGMVLFPLRRAANIHRQRHTVDKRARAALKQQRPCIVWFTGLSGSGKSTIADLVERTLHARGIHTMLLDGDNVRLGLNHDLGFTDADRVENIRRVGEVAKLFVESGLVVLCCFISPFRAERQMVRGLVQPEEFCEVFVDTPIEVCIDRDAKGLYRKALAGEIPNFTGIGSPYERPDAPEITIATLAEPPYTAAERVVDWVLARIQPGGQPTGAAGTSHGSAQA